jgi:hypothetical protein
VASPDIRGQEVHELREDGAAAVHAGLLVQMEPDSVPGRSNRLELFLLARSLQCYGYISSGNKRWDSSVLVYPVTECSVKCVCKRVRETLSYTE